MFSRIGQIIFDHEAVLEASDFKMGIEIEMNRVDKRGHLSREPYPAAVGDQAQNPWLTNDFLSTMSEIVTPAADNATDAMHYLYSINTALRTALAPGEYLWPMSMPPILPDDPHDLPIAATTPEKREYFDHWLERHRPSEGTPQGAHINLSINQNVIKLLSQELALSEKAVKNHLYKTLAQGFIRYRWVITYLFGASPVAEANFYGPDQQPFDHPVRSIRQSHRYGLGNDFIADYTSVETYARKIQEAVDAGELLKPTDYHGSVRFKGADEMKDLAIEGAKYLELRMLDLDPTSSIGIRTGTIRSIRLLAGYFLMSPAINDRDVNDVLKRADQMNGEVAEEMPTERTQYYEEARAFIERLQQFVNQIQAGPEYQEILYDFEYRINHPETTPSGRLVEKLHNGSLVDYAMRKAIKYQEGAQQALKPFHGFEENNGNLSADLLAKELFGGSWRVNYHE